MPIPFVKPMANITGNMWFSRLWVGVVLGSVLLFSSADAQGRVLPGTSKGQYCGCRKSRGICLKPGATATECVYKACDIYKCDAIQTDTPKLICLQKVSPTTLSATGNVSPKADARVQCTRTLIGHIFLTLYAAGKPGTRVNWAGTARKALIVRLAAIGDGNTQVQALASAIAKVIANPTDRDAGSVLRSVSQILAAETGNDQDLLGLDPSRAKLAGTVNRMEL